MMATSNSTLGRRAFWSLLLALAAAAGVLRANETPPAAVPARAEYQRAQREYQSYPSRTNAWQLARATFDFAEFATNAADRATLANQGIAAARALIRQQPESAAGHYYLAMNLGQLARTELLGALTLVKEMEREFRLAAGLDPLLDHAGPERNLGLLYRDAPGWPTSIGNQSKALGLLKQAARLAPEYPENHLHLIEAYLKWHDADGAKKELRVLDAIWPAAQKSLTGEKWAYRWQDWSQRRDAVRRQITADTTS